MNLLYGLSLQFINLQQSTSNQILLLTFIIQDKMSLRKAKQLLELKKAQQQKLKIPQQQQIEQQVYTKKTNTFSFNQFDNDQSQQQPEQIKQVQQKVQQENQGDKKKKKKKKKKLTEEQQLEKALKEFGLDKKVQKNSQQIEAQEKKIWQKILDINETKFNYQKQLKRHFKNWQQEKPQNDPELDKRQQKLQKHLRKMMKKSVLSPGIKQFFPINQKFQLELSQSTIKFLPSKKYQHFQVQYDMIRNTNDINALFQFTQTHPQHVDSVYAVGQFLRLQGNYRDADSLIQKVIYIYEMAGSYELMQFVKVGMVGKQVVYDTYSKSFFMSLFKFMDILGKKGCFRAALEYNKFLLKINVNDPSACLLCLDYNAISANQPEFLIDFVTYYSHYIGSKNTSLYLMPNFIYSFALAKFSLENKQTKVKSQLVIEQNDITDLILFSQQDWKAALVLPSNQSFIKQSCRTLLLRAIMIYSRLILDIGSKNEYSKQFLNHPKFQGNQKKTFKNLLQHEFWTMVPQSYSYHFLRLQNENDSKGLDKILEVYVQRSKILWKSNEVMLWVKAALGFVLNQVDRGFNYQQFLEGLCTEECGGISIPFQLARYQNVSKANFSDRVQRIDLNNIQDNQRVQPQQNANRMNLQGNGIRLFLNSLLPWVNLPQNNNNEQFDPNMPFIEQDD